MDAISKLEKMLENGDIMYSPYYGETEIQEVFREIRQEMVDLMRANSFLVKLLVDAGVSVKKD